MEQRTVILDVETTGTNPSRHEISQFAGLVVDEYLAEVEWIEMKLHFDRKRANSEALRVFKFDPLLWRREALSQREGVILIDEWLRKHATVWKQSSKGTKYRVARVVGHNVRYDLDFLQATFKRNGKPFLPVSWHPLDTLHGAIWRFAQEGVELKSYSLEALTKYFGIENKKAHDALSDCRATLNLLRVLMRVDPVVTDKAAAA